MYGNNSLTHPSTTSATNTRQSTATASMPTFNTADILLGYSSLFPSSPFLYGMAQNPMTSMLGQQRFVHHQSGEVLLPPNDPPPPPPAQPGTSATSLLSRAIAAVVAQQNSPAPSPSIQPLLQPRPPTASEVVMNSLNTLAARGISPTEILEILSAETTAVSLNDERDQLSMSEMSSSGIGEGEGEGEAEVDVESIESGDDEVT